MCMNLSVRRTDGWIDLCCFFFQVGLVKSIFQVLVNVKSRIEYKIKEVKTDSKPGGRDGVGMFSAGQACSRQDS